MTSLRAVVLASYAWAAYCMFYKQAGRWDASGAPPGGGFVHYPVQLTCVALFIDNVRLALGCVLGKGGASEFLAHTWYLLQSLDQAALLSAHIALLGAALEYPALRYVGGAAAIFYVMNALNTYVSCIHGNLEYTETGGIPRYTRTTALKQGKPPAAVLVYPQHILVSLATFVSFVSMVTFLDIVPFLMQVCAVVGQSILQTHQDNKRLVTNFVQLLSIASIIRNGRYVF